MITLITGNPGAGKTLYSVSKLLPEFLKARVTHDGKTKERRLFANINGLLLDHDPCDADMLSRWPQWVVPGDVIIFDEVQEVWRPRANGATVPDAVKALEKHRHFGVDFVLLTQKPHLLDSNVRELVGRHFHVRRVGGTGTALVYEWDHCSRRLNYAQSVAKKPFVYPRSAFKLYKSAELHTKQGGSMPPLLWFVAAGVAAFAFAGPRVYARITDASTPKVAAAAVAPGKAASAPAGAASAAVARIAGCWSVDAVCRCMYDNGKPARMVPRDICEVSSRSFDGAVEWMPRAEPATDLPYGAAARSPDAPGLAPVAPLSALPRT
jgi:zona occludens toxin